jgi:type VI secretion system protein ImpC
MIAFDVEERKSKPAPQRDAKTRYLLLGDFGGRGVQSVAAPATADRDNIDEVLSRFDVSLAGLRMREVEDFHPDRIYHHLNQGMELVDSGGTEEEPSREHSSPRADLQELLRPGSILEQITEGGDPFQRYVRDLARAHAAPAQRDQTARNTALSERMNALLHHPRFQTVEAAWRGLDLVVRNADEGFAPVHVAQFSRQDLEQDLAEASDLRSTRFFKLLTSREWKGVFALYSFGAEATDIEMLGRIALIAAHARTAFVAEGSANKGEHFEELTGIPEARFLGLALPRLLLRLPYGAKVARIESFAFEEMPAKPVHAHYLWGNPALAVLAIAARGGIENDELDLDHLPVHTYEDRGEWHMTPCAEVWMTEPEVRALMDQGLMPLVSFRDDDRVRLAGVRSITGSALAL